MIPDFRNVTGFDDIYSRFLMAARSIMLEHDLVFDQFAERPLHITSLELYLRCSQWLDPNTDKNCEQGNSKTWYIRRRGSNANTSRVDITAGCRAENIYCGLLVRGIDGDDGSGKAIKTILRGGKEASRRSWLEEEVKILDQIHGSQIVDGPLRLVRRENPLAGALYGKPRVGLRYPGDPWNQKLRIVVEQPSLGE
jgi:hypothetical protein